MAEKLHYPEKLIESDFFVLQGTGQKYRLYRALGGRLAIEYKKPYHRNRIRIHTFQFKLTCRLRTHVLKLVAILCDAAGWFVYDYFKWSVNLYTIFFTAIILYAGMAVGDHYRGRAVDDMINRNMRST